MKKTNARYMTAVAALSTFMTLSPQAKAQYVERAESVRMMAERLKKGKTDLMEIAVRKYASQVESTVQRKTGYRAVYRKTIV